MIKSKYIEEVEADHDEFLELKQPMQHEQLLNAVKDGNKKSTELINAILQSNTNISNLATAVSQIKIPEQNTSSIDQLTAAVTANNKLIIEGFAKVLDSNEKLEKSNLILAKAISDRPTEWKMKPNKTQWGVIIDVTLEAVQPIKKLAN